MGIECVGGERSLAPLPGRARRVQDPSLDESVLRVPAVGHTRELRCRHAPQAISRPLERLYVALVQNVFASRNHTW